MNRVPRRSAGRAIIALSAGLTALAIGAAAGRAQLPPLPATPGLPPVTPAPGTPPPGTTATIAPGSTITVPGTPTPVQPGTTTAAAPGPDTPLAPGTGFETVGPPPPRGPALLRPFPIVRIAGRLTAAGARIRVLSVRAPAGARVRVICRGRGCPRVASRAVVRAGAARTGRVRFARLQRPLRAGVTIQVLVTKPRRIGKYTRFTIRRGLAPRRRDACLPPPGSGRRPRSCPGSAS